ncbi:MAG: hypothetical protein RI554_03275 [Trueperaceae bacterium]|nr:hypothetical protein [Trueperaceae bacterium]
MNERARVRRRAGVTIAELILAVAVLSVALALGAGPLRDAVARQGAEGPVATFRVAVRDVAVAAAAQGEPLTLAWAGDRLEMRDASGVVQRDWPFPADTPTTLTPGVLLEATPPGRFASLDPLPDPLTFDVEGAPVTVRVSLIGESERTP